MKITTGKELFNCLPKGNLPSNLPGLEPFNQLKKDSLFQPPEPDGFPEPAKTSPMKELAYSFVVSKLRSGQELTSYELSLLKKKDPALYSKAVKAQKARAELRRRLENAKTKKEFDNACASAAGVATASLDLTGNAGASAPTATDSSPSCTDATLSQFALSSSALQNETGNFYGKRHRLQNEEILQEKQSKNP